MATGWQRMVVPLTPRKHLEQTSSQQQPGHYPLQNHYGREFVEEELLGTGSFGVVTKAKNKLDSANYAIKIIPLRAKGLRDHSKILREVCAMASLNHPNIVRYHTTWLQNYDLPHKLKGETYYSTDEDESDTLLSSNAINESSSEDNMFPVLNNININSSSGESRELSIASSSTNSSESSRNSYKGFPTLLLSSNAINESSSEDDMFPVLNNININSSSVESRELSIASSSTNSSESSRFPTLFIQMGLCGQSLRNWLDKRDEMENCIVQHRKSLGLFFQLLEAIDYVHSNDIIHRDITPANIFFSQNGKTLQLGDFGLARPLEASLYNETESVYKVGNSMYTAPELDMGEVYSEESDMYSIGLILLELFYPFYTKSERYRVFQSLKTSHLLDNTILQGWPSVRNIILSLTNLDASERPAAKEVLEYSIFDIIPGRKTTLEHVGRKRSRSHLSYYSGHPSY